MSIARYVNRLLTFTVNLFDQSDEKNNKLEKKFTFETIVNSVVLCVIALIYKKI